MMKSDKLLSRFDNIESDLESAKMRLGSLPVDLVDQGVVFSLQDKISEILSELEELTYTSVGPLQTEEEQTLAEIEEMEAKLFEMRASLR